MSKAKTQPASGSASTAADSGNNGDASGGSSAITTVTHDELAGLGGDLTFDSDGLQQVGAEDIRIAAYVINMAGIGKDGRALPKDEYYNTIDETSKRKVNGVFLHLHKTHLFSRFLEAEKRTEIMCRSYDRKVGTMASGVERPCQGCPDAQWQAGADGKRKRNCSPVYNMFAVDRDEALGFVTRFKRTSLPVIKQYLQKHHIGRRVVRGQRLNYPLHVFGVELTARMDPKGQYAIPVLNRGPVLTREEVELFGERAHEVRELVIPILNNVEALAEARESTGDGEGDTSFDTGKMAADEGRDFADA